MEPSEIHALEPRITPDNLGGTLVEDVIMLDSYNLTLATAQAAESRGVEIVIGEATGVIYDGDRAVGVNVTGGRIDCDAVVLALGPW